MLDNILDGLKGQVVSAISEKTGLDAGQAEQAMPMAKESIMEGVMGAVGGGNLSGIMGMFSGGGGGMMQNMVYQGIAQNFIGKLTGGLGVNSGIAGTISSTVLPMIMSKISGSAADADGNVSENGIMSALGVDSGGLMGKVGDMLGGASDAAGGAADGAGSLVDGLKDKAADALKDKAGDLLGGIGGMFGK